MQESLASRAETELIQRCLEFDPTLRHHFAVASESPALLAVVLKECANRLNIEEGISIGKIIGGATSLLKSVSKRHRATDQLYRRRLQACSSCPNKVESTRGFYGIANKAGYKDICGLCGCVIEFKAKIKEEVCPAPGIGNRWINLD